MYNAKVLNEAIYKSTNNGNGRVFWSRNANPYLEYMTNSMKTKVCPLHYWSRIKFYLPPGSSLAHQEIVLY